MGRVSELWRWSGRRFIRVVRGVRGVRGALEVLGCGNSDSWWGADKDGIEWQAFANAH